MECVVTSVVEKRLGALPAAAGLLRRLDVAGTVDRLCPGRDIAHLTHGQVIEALVANRLTAPSPLWRVVRWARAWAVEEVFGIEPELLNDDRLGRTLDPIAPHLTEIADSTGARAISEVGIDVSTLHGGHDIHVVIQAGLAATGGGGLPLLSRVIDGGAAEISRITGTMNSLRAMAGPKGFLLIVDSNGSWKTPTCRPGPQERSPA